jgi:hypothetical protein
LTYSIYLSSGALYFRVYTSGDIYTVANATVPVGGWTHFAFVRNGNVFTAYINGASVGSTTQAITLNFANGWFLGMGSPVGDTQGGYFKGYLSNHRIVKGTALYTSSFTPSTTPLTAVSGTSLLTCQSNRFKDNSSNNFAITVNGNTSVQRFSPFNPTAPYSTSTIGGSGYFDGSGDYLTVANNSAFQFGTGDYTFEAWVYQTNSASFQRVIALGNYVHSTANGNWAIEITSGSVLVHNNGSYITFAAGLAINIWNHLAVVRSSGSVSVFLNGVKIGASQTQSGNINSTLSLAIGAQPAGDAFWYGYLSNIRLVKGTAVYTTNFTPPTAPLTAITNTSLLCNFTNAGIPDAAMMNDLETVGNAQVSTSVKKYGTGSLAFDGTGDWLTFNSSDLLSFGTGNFTVEFWMYPTAITAQMNVIATGGSFATNSARIGKDTSLGMTLYSNNGTGVIVSEGNNTYISGAANKWTYYAFVRNGNSFTLYRDGTSVGTGTSSGAVTLSLSGSTVIGTDWANDYFNGYIDDLRITKGYARYTANFTPPAQALPTQ